MSVGRRLPEGSTSAPGTEQREATWVERRRNALLGHTPPHRPQAIISPARAEIRIRWWRARSGSRRVACDGLLLALSGLRAPEHRPRIIPASLCARTRAWSSAASAGQP